MTARATQGWLAGVIRIGTLVWLIVHFVLTIVYVMPVNPVKLNLQPVLNATIGTYFQQNWSLFAPNPLSSNQALLARPLTAAEVELIETDGLPVSGWYDLSTPVWAHFQENRFSAYDRLSRPASNALREYLTGGTRLVPWREACQKGDSAACSFFEVQHELARAQAGRLLARVGSAFCNGLPGAGQRFSHVALRVRETASVPWSARYTGKPRVRDIELGVYPIDRNVVSSGLYLVRKLE